MTRFLVACVLAALGATSLAAQTPRPAAPVQPPPQQPPFRATTTLVEVDAIAADGKGQFVAGLTADDFEVVEDGKPQTIERIYAVRAPSISTYAPSGVRPRSSAITPPQRVFVLFFDSEHLNQSSIKRLKTAAERFLVSEFQPEDLGGILVGTRMVGNGLTNDRDALLRGLREWKMTPSQTSRTVDMADWPRMSEVEAIRIALYTDEPVLQHVADRARNEIEVGRGGELVDFTVLVQGKAREVVNRMRPASARTLGALQALLNGLERVPGRKSVVLLTEGFFVEESWAQLRQLVGLAARANVRIYSIDAQGTNRHTIANDPSQIAPVDTGAAMPTEIYNTVEDGPNTLAVDTGGYVCRYSNDFGAALSGIAHDTSQYYVIGYSPTNAAPDGSFRKITVHVKRPGVSVRARRGYIAAPSPAVTTLSGSPQLSPNAPAGDVNSIPTDAVPAMPPARETPTVNPTSSAPALPTGVPPPAIAPPPASAGSAVDATNTVAAFNLRPDSIARVRELAPRNGVAEATDTLSSLGWDHYQKGDLEGAAELLGKAAADPHIQPWVRYALGYAELGLRHVAKAADAWEKVRSAVPEFRNVYLDLADAYLQMEDYGRAIDVLKVADGRWPGDVDVLNAMGTLQVRRGALNDAISTFKKATKANPDDALAYFNLGRTYELRYFKTRRYLHTEGRWIANRADVDNAIASYNEYVRLGGPFETNAREAIQNLQWIK